MSRYSVRPVGAPTANIPATSRDKTRKNRQVVKSIIDSGCFFLLTVISARHGRHGGLVVVVGEEEEGVGERLCSPPIAVYAHDPAPIPEQAHGNMAACTTTERREELWEGGREGRRDVDSAVRLCSVFSEPLLVFATSSGGFLQVPGAGCRSTAMILSLVFVSSYRPSAHKKVSHASLQISPIVKEIPDFLFVFSAN